MNNYIKAIEDIKKLLNEEIESCTVTVEKRNTFITAYYDLCFVQERLEKCSSGLQINNETKIQ